MTTDTSQGGIDLDAIEARERAATPGPWERGDIWMTAGLVYDQNGNRVGKGGTHCAYCNHGEPEQSCRINVNGTVMAAHRHRDGDPYGIEHRISGPNGVTVAGNYDYEAGGILAPEDTEFIAAARSDVPALIAEVRRLRAELAEMAGYRDAYMRDRDRWHAENARLRERLDAAELVCLGYGSMGVSLTTDRQKATHELWVAWAAYHVRHGGISRKLLPDERIAELARQRDAKQDAAIARLMDGQEVPDADV